MKVEVTVSRESLVINVDGFVLDVYKELEAENVEGAGKKHVWLASVAYEIRRRHVRLVEIEKKAYMSFWGEWAVKWLKVKDLQITLDTTSSTIARMFGDLSITDKIRYVFEIGMRLMPQKQQKWDRWKDFFDDTSVDPKLKELCRDMYALEFEKGMTYDKIADLEARMAAMVDTLKVAAEGYRVREARNGGIRF
jgi:hypothetical protein